jgi:hypothetical protein
MEISVGGSELGFRVCSVVVGFVFGGWDVPYLTVEPEVVVPVDPLGGGEFDV